MPAAMPLILVLLALLLAGPLAAGPAQAHAILMDSRPALRGTVPAGAASMSLRFNSRIARPRARLRRLRPDGAQTVRPLPVEGPPDRLETTADLSPGDYTIRWQVLAVDGHITRGDVPFTVGSPQAAR